MTNWQFRFKIILYTFLTMNHIAKGIGMGNFTKKSIAVVVMNMDNAYSTEILRGVVEEAKVQECDVAIYNAFINQEELVAHNKGQFNIYNLMDLKKYDGAVFLPNLIKGHVVYDELVDRFTHADIPVASVDMAIPGLYHVGAENYYSMKSIVEHFIVHHGYSRIECVSGPEQNPDAQERLKAYLDAMDEHGLSDNARSYEGLFTHEHGKEVAISLLQRAGEGEPLPQAVVCCSDDIAVGMSMELQNHGIRVPEDVAIAGFDNSFEAANSVPRITTVSRPLAEMGRRATRKVCQAINGQMPETDEMLSSIPIYSQSCGCKNEEPEDDDTLRARYLRLTERFERYMATNTFMTEELNGSISFDDMLRRLKNYVGVLGTDHFYYCLDSSLVRYLRLADKNAADYVQQERVLTEGYAPVMSPVIAYENGQFVEYDDFPSSQIVPWSDKDSRKAEAYVISPVHFSDRCYGYVMVENCDFVTSSMLYRNWLVILINGLENIRKQVNLKHMLYRVDRLYVTDPLTGLYNRSGFARYTSDSFRICAREKAGIMILFADMDGLKKINDRYGHDKGDIAIVAIADALRTACLGGEVCARFGGDEYVVYAEDYEEADARRFCARFESALEHFNMKEEQPFTVNASFGYRVFVPKENDLIDKYIDSADEKMYDIKRKKYQK